MRMTYLVFMVMLVALFVLTHSAQAHRGDCVYVVKVVSMEGCEPCKVLLHKMEKDGAKLEVKTTSTQPQVEAFPTVIYKDAQGNERRDRGEIYSRGCVGFLNPVVVELWRPRPEP